MNTDYQNPETAGYKWRTPSIWTAQQFKALGSRIEQKGFYALTEVIMRLVKFIFLIIAAAVSLVPALVGTIILLCQSRSRTKESLALDDKPPAKVLREKIREKAELAVKFGRKIVWIPHPKFENRETFTNDVAAGTIFRTKHLVHWYSQSKAQELIQQKNIILSWLNEGRVPKERNKTRVICMNCSDFVNMILFQAGATTKDQITEGYRDYRRRQLSEQETDLGFAGYPFHSVEREKVITQAKLGDLILIKNEKNGDLHAVLRADGKDDVYSLWDNHPAAPGVLKISLDDLENGRNFSYRVCSLKDFMQTQARGS